MKSHGDSCTMFHDDAAAVTLPGGPARLAAAPPEYKAALFEKTARPGRYGEDSKTNWSTVIGVVLLHVVVFAAAALLQPGFAKHVAPRLRVFDVKLEPPAAEPKPAEPTRQKPDLVKLTPVSVTPPTPVLAAAIVPAPQSEAVPPQPTIAAPAPPEPAPPSAPPTIQGGDLGAQMIAGKPPRYPVECRRNHEQGTVVLMLVVGTDGRVVDIAVSRSSGSPRLDSAARDAVRSWRWAPITRNGQPVIVRGVVEIPFVLQG